MYCLVLVLEGPFKTSCSVPRGKKWLLDLFIYLQICLFQGISDGLGRDWIGEKGIVGSCKLSSIVSLASKHFAWKRVFGSF